MVLSARSVKFLGDLHCIHDGMGQLSKISQKYQDLSQSISKYLKHISNYLKVSQNYLKTSQIVKKFLKFSDLRNYVNISPIISKYIQQSGRSAPVDPRIDTLLVQSRSWKTGSKANIFLIGNI